MPQQHDMFSDDGRERRDEGIERVLGNVSPTWRIAYRVTANRWFVTEIPLQCDFTMEDLHEYAEPLIGKPHHPNAWGGEAQGILRDWLTSGRIVRMGVKQADRVLAHARNLVVYRKVKP